MPVRVVVTCSNRKSVEVPPELHLRHVNEDAPEARAEAWLARVEGASQTVRAFDLYAGDHWTVASSIPERAADLGFGAELWTISAGLGLLADESEVPPYAATFTMGDPDSVVPASVEDAAEYSRRWWRALAARGDENHPRSLAALAAEAPADPLVVAVSPTYVAPLINDIGAAAESLDSSDLLTVVCGGRLPDDTPIREFLVPVDARFQGELGGSLISLNARVAAYAVEKLGADVRRPRILDHFQKVLEGLPRRKLPDRKTLTDKEVSAFISEKLREHPDMARTPMLRVLRDVGYACEQNRFKRLYEGVSAEEQNHSLF